MRTQSNLAFMASSISDLQTRDERRPARVTRWVHIFARGRSVTNREGRASQGAKAEPLPCSPCRPISKRSMRQPAGWIVARDLPQLAGADFVMGDLFNRDALARACSGHDTAINLATHMPSAPWKMVFRGAWRPNDHIRREGVANLVDAALHAGIGRVVQESFALTYPDRGDAWIDEETPLEPSDYNGTVLDAEASVARFTAAGRAGVVLRFAAFYGADAMQVRTYVAAVRRGWAPLPGAPDAYISSVSHDDAAAAVVAALRAPAGAYNVVDDQPLRRRDCFAALAENL